MRYALLIHVDETLWQDMTEAQRNEEMGQYTAFGERNKAKIVSGEALYGNADTVTVRVQDGQAATTKGPANQTLEHVSGFYVVECASIEEAAALAAEIPDAKRGSVEIRQVIDFG